MGDPFGPFIDSRERDLEVARRRMWLPVTVLAVLFCWALCYGLFILMVEIIDAWIMPIAR